MKKTSILTPVGLSLVASALVSAPGCGNSGTLGRDDFPVLQAVVDGKEFTEPYGGEVSFGQALQLAITKEVQLINPGFVDVTVDSIDWMRDADDLQQKNPYVSYQGLPSAFPITIAAGDFIGVTFEVKYEPPLDGALDDFSDSVLRITSPDARTGDGSAELPEIFVTFSMPSKIPCPELSPSSFEFNNATPTTPDKQTFCVTNCAELGTTAFTVNSVQPLATCSEFKLTVVPPLPHKVEPQSSLDYEAYCFEITYHPVDEGNDDCLFQVATDAGEFNVSVKSDLQVGSYSWSCNTTGDEPFDFTSATTEECRTCILSSDGPGPITVKTPSITPGDAEAWYTWECFKPATSPEAEPTPVTSWPQGMTLGKTLECDVCFTPLADPGLEPHNGEFVVPIEKPDKTEARFDLLAGQPKSHIDCAPATGNVWVTASVAEGATGTRNVVIYNDGNGTLEVSDVQLHNKFNGDAVIFWVLSGPTAPFTIAPGGLEVFELAWDASLIADLVDGDLENMVITYVDPYLKAETDKFMALFASDSGESVAPTAVATIVSTDHVVGEPVLLDAFSSDEGSSSFNFTDDSYIWYLIDKPDGSHLQLNEQSGPETTFVPDVAGDYEVELVVFTTGAASSFLQSTGASSGVITVGAAPDE